MEMLEKNINQYDDKFIHEIEETYKRFRERAKADI